MSTHRSQCCITCGKTAGVFLCPGCSETFCLVHTSEHRHLLEQQLDEIILKEKNLTENTTDQHQRSLMEQVDQWEQQSIDKIHQTANNIRNQLVQHAHGYSHTIGEDLILLKKKLKHARDSGNYFEKDIREWTERLSQLKQSFVKQQNMRIEHVETLTSFIRKIALIGKPSDNNQPLEQATIYNEYAWGNHEVRFILQEYQPTSRVFIGIISKKATNHADPYRNPTFYGWGKYNIVYLHGTVNTNYKNYRNDMEKGDVMQLIFDCDRRKIQLYNERTKITHEINVDLAKCPFPWIPHIRLNNLS
ncbi:unnamed protein product [Adineta ricciae]|uniref:B box-type domain-containing protein n=1 Tax=Adineta ricciae TaxID=249248 RepID=A0A813NSC9_ADIRI|nr:unnamed protein product [Adineta ricciae]CAF0793222.1 unnamed protein product [Adineta ricciae]